MERRNFIKRTMLVTGALSLPLSESTVFAGNAAAQPAAVNFKKSIMWEGIGIEGSIADKCKAVKEAGFQGIQPSSHMDRKAVIEGAKANGLAITDVCCSTHWNKPLSHPDAAVRQEGIDGVTIALEDAKEYGTDAILLVPGVVNDTVSYDECWKRSIEGIKKLLPIAQKLKIKICVENVWNNFLLSPMEACQYIDQFKSPYVQFYFDCGNILAYGWPEQWINILGKDRIGRIHIKEYSRQIADRQGRRLGFNVPLTEGDVDWAKVMDALRKNYKHEWIATEQGTCKTLDELKDLNNRFDKILSM